MASSLIYFITSSVDDVSSTSQASSTVVDFIPSLLSSILDTVPSTPSPTTVASTGPPPSASNATISIPPIETIGIGPSTSSAGVASATFQLSSTALPSVITITQSSTMNMPPPTSHASMSSLISVPTQVESRMSSPDVISTLFASSTSRPSNPVELSNGEKAGIASGVASIALVVVGLFVYFFLARRKRRKLKPSGLPCDTFQQGRPEWRAELHGIGVSLELDAAHKKEIGAGTTHEWHELPG
ncbi:hypothetical protein EG329_011783 [Mollisiaceae sp. DMI_Dod_QoI]|nr:hypothetical protein EG329_011783 [Helotiales sp. DMI_Dod_QoI]